MNNIVVPFMYRFRERVSNEVKGACQLQKEPDGA